jgi:TIR domain-containing protein
VQPKGSDPRDPGHRPYRLDLLAKRRCQQTTTRLGVGARNEIFMESILIFVAYGASISGDDLDDAVVRTHLSAFEEYLTDADHRWTDVSLIVFANSKIFGSNRQQAHADEIFINGLTAFCKKRNWYPSLIGTTVYSSFFRNGQGENLDISNGIMLIAVISAVFDKVPVNHISGGDKAHWKAAGRQAVNACTNTYRRMMNELYGVNMANEQVQDSSMGLLFTSGSGYVTREFIDFTDCYALGQELLSDWDDARIVGGCSTNRSANQLQCIYYSITGEDGETVYHRTYSHCAAVALLPYASPRFLLLQPYSIHDDRPLRIEWDPRDAYAIGRYYHVRSINDESPVDFFSRHWGLSRDKLNQMCETRAPLPHEPKTYRFTIASSSSSLDRNIWPNAPVWLERVDNGTTLRLVRAEAHDSNYYLMAMGDGSESAAVDAIGINCYELQSYFQSYSGRKSTVLSFICESRKFLLESLQSNIEAELISRLIPEHTQVVGLYLNGEYSTGVKRSIGYHNLSQITAIIADRPVSELPAILEASRRARPGLRIFVSHANRDKALVKQVMGHMRRDVARLMFWIDEDQLLTGSNLENEIRLAIDSGTNYFVVFLSESAVRSQWVRDEIFWAIEREMAGDATFVLPVMIDDVWAQIETGWPDEIVYHLKRKKHLVCTDYSDEGVLMCARRLARHVEEWARRACY